MSKLFPLVIFILSMDALSIPQDREIWIKENTDSISKVMCDKKSYFRQCFLIDATSCLAHSKASVSFCMDEYRAHMPKSLEQPYHDRKYRPLIGSCSGSQYQSRLGMYLKNEEKCSPSSYWER